jgi:hypothetical protein
LDDEIYNDFLKSFPEYASPEWNGEVDEDEMKSAQGKKRWREFMMRYEKKVNMHAPYLLILRLLYTISAVFFEYRRKWNMKRRLQFLVPSFPS